MKTRKNNTRFNSVPFVMLRDEFKIDRVKAREEMEIHRRKRKEKEAKK